MAIVGVFLLLVMIHMSFTMVQFQQGQKSRLLGTALVSVSLFGFGILLISPQMFSHIQLFHPAPDVVYPLLALSLIFGIMYILRPDVPHITSSTPGPGSDQFPESLRSRFEEVRFLSSGGVGSIWYGRTMDGREVAIKIPAKNDEQTGRSFLQEIQVWRELVHDNIVHVYSANILPVPYLEMEYVPSTLKEIQVPISCAQARTIILGVISGLAYAHERGVVHCDIKPGNILLTKDGVPKISDWGISRKKSSRWFVKGFSTRYAAPEQRGLFPECGPEVDVYQAGLLFVWLITGESAMPLKVDPVCPVPDTDMTRIISRCLAHDPDERYPDCIELYADLTHSPHILKE